MQQAIEQALVGRDLLLNDAVIDGRLILRQRFATLLFKRFAQLLLACVGLTEERFEVCKNRGALAVANLFDLTIELGNLRVDLLDLGRLFGGRS